MRKKLLIGALSVLGLILLLAIGLFFYIRGGRLDQLLEREIIVSLEDFGIRAEIGRTRLDIRGYKVTLEDIRLYAGDGIEPFGSIERLAAEFSIADYLRRRINITQVLVDKPEVWIDFDERGRSNIDALHLAPESAEEAAIKFLTAQFTVQGGVFNYSDRRNDLTARLQDLFVNLTPREPDALKDEINHRMEIRLGGGHAVYQGRRIDRIDSQVDGYITGETAELSAIRLVSDLGESRASGRIGSFDPVKYEFKVNQLTADLAHISRVFIPDTQLEGKASFAGRIEGTGSEYHADGVVASDSLVAEGFTISDFKVETDISGSGTVYRGRADVTAGPISGRDVSVDSLRLSGATLGGREADFDLAGNLAMASLRSGRLTVSRLTGRLELDPNRVSLHQLSGDALGGRLSGTASIGLQGGTSQVDLRFDKVNLNQVASLAAARDAEVQGSATGTARLAFPGLNFEAATGRVEFAFDAAISPPGQEEDAAPANGQVVLLARGRGFDIERAFVRSASSEVVASGRIDTGGNLALDIKFRSADMSEVQRVVEAFGLIPQDTRDQYEIALSGSGEFIGSVEGNLSAPSIRGRALLEEIHSNDALVGRFEGDIAYSPRALLIENGSVVRPDGSRADFSISAPLLEEDRISVKASVRDFDLSTIVRAAVPGFSDFVGAGKITGNVDLTGLPGPRTIEGTANITLSGGELLVPSPEEGEETRRITVPEFVGEISFADSVLRVKDLNLKTAESAFTGQLSFNLDTYEYSVNAEGANVDLAQVSGALTEAVQLSGRASVKVVGEGKWDDWSDIKLDATIQGQNVAINGRALGDARLVARTENGLLRIEATGELLEQERTLAATIDLKDRTNYPVSAKIEFTDAEIGSYLSLVSPELSGITGQATGSIELGGPLQNPNQLEVRARLSRIEIGGAIAEGQVYRITNEGEIVIRGTPERVTVEPVTFTGEGTRLGIEGTISREAGVRSSLKVDGEVNLRFLSSFIPSVFATGIATVEASITGTLSAPQLLGFVNLKDVGLRVVDVPVSVSRGSGQIRFTANQALIENFVATTPGGGTVTIAGGAALSGLVPDRWRIETRADQVGFEFPRDTQTVVDANLGLQGNRRVQVLSGTVNVRRALYTRDLTIEELITGGGPFGRDFLEVGPGSAGGSAAGPLITLDISVTADNTLRVRNNLADAVGSAYLNIRGGINDPLISGRVLLSRGTLEFRQGRHELTRGIITFPGRRRADPVIDLQTEAEIAGHRVYTSFTGPLSRLQTTLRSDPELPEPDIVSLILTGTVAGDRQTEATALQSGLGLAQSLLSASVSEQVERRAQRLFGISRFSIDPLIVGRGNDPTARITIGQRINRNLTITYSQNLTAGPSGVDRIVLVEYRISNRYSIVGFRNDRGELGFDVRIRKRF